MHAQLRPEDASEEYRQQFWARVAKRGPDDCWEWMRCRDPKGYGRVAWPGRVTHRTHRVAYALTHGNLGDLHVLHKCDNPPCVNPTHLFLGTHAENVADMTAKGRSTRGVAHALAKLDDGKVGAILWLSSVGNSRKSIGKMFGVQDQAIGKIVRRERWAHVAEWTEG